MSNDANSGLNRKNREKIKRKNQTKGDAGNLRGLDSEEKCFKACCVEKFWPSWLGIFRRALPYENEFGADLVFITDYGKIYLQIKTSINGIIKHRNNWKYKDIPVVSIADAKNHKEIRRRVKNAVTAERSKRIQLNSWEKET